MSAKNSGFQKVVGTGSVSVKIYKVRNKVYRTTLKNGTVKTKPRFCFKVSFFANRRRFQKDFADLAKAKAYAVKSSEAIDSGHLGALPFTDADARLLATATEAVKPTGLPLDLVAKEYVALWLALGGKEAKVTPLEVIRDHVRRGLHKLPKILLPFAVDEMHKQRKDAGTNETYLKVLRVYLYPLKEAFNCPLTSIMSAQISEYLRKLDVGARSKNNTRATIGAFFKFCKEQGWLPRDHEGIELVSKFKEPVTDITIFTPWEVTQFLTRAREKMIPFLAIGAFAGLRSAEIERLDWNEVHVADKFIEVKAQKAKTASRRIVPISDNLAAWLKERVKTTGSVVPYDNVNKQIGWLEEDVDEALAMAALKKAAAKAGNDDWKPDALLEYHRKCGKAARSEDALKEGKTKRSHAKTEQPKARPGLTFLPDQTPVKYQPCPWKKNALRHSYISYRVAEVQDVPKVALEAGNSGQMIFQHYRELVQAKDAKEWFGIMPA